MSKRCVGGVIDNLDHDRHTRLHESVGAGRSVNERVVLITGAGQRLGAATAARLMDEGIHVLVHVRSSIDAAKQLIDDATRRNGEVRGTIVTGDLTVDAEVDSLIASVKAHPLVEANGLFGLVHNASFYSQASFEDVSLETFRSLNRLHMEAPFVLTQSLLTDLMRGGGSVIAIVDTSWGRAWEGLAHYTSSKAGLRQLMLNLAGELAGRVRVNCLAPGAIMAAEWEAEHFASVLEKVPLGRSGAGQDIAAGVHFLLTNGTITGNVLHVDGGWTLNE
jgi:pteridine reductase